MGGSISRVRAETWRGMAATSRARAALPLAVLVFATSYALPMTRPTLGFGVIAPPALAETKVTEATTVTQLQQQKSSVDEKIAAINETSATSAAMWRLMYKTRHYMRELDDSFAGFVTCREALITELLKPSAASSSPFFFSLPPFLSCVYGAPSTLLCSLTHAPSRAYAVQDIDVAYQLNKADVVTNNRISLQCSIAGLAGGLLILAAPATLGVSAGAGVVIVGAVCGVAVAGYTMYALLRHDCPPVRAPAPLSEARTPVRGPAFHLRPAPLSAGGSKCRSPSAWSRSSTHPRWPLPRIKRPWRR